MCILKRLLSEKTGVIFAKKVHTNFYNFKKYENYFLVIFFLANYTHSCRL